MVTVTLGTTEGSAITVEAAKQEDPVVHALNILELKEVGSSGKLKVFRRVTGGLGLNIASFIEELNSILQKKMVKGDKPFSAPRFDGQYVVSYGAYGSKVYSIGINVGALLLRVKERR